MQPGAVFNTLPSKGSAPHGDPPAPLKASVLPTLSTSFARRRLCPKSLDVTQLRFAPILLPRAVYPGPLRVMGVVATALFLAASPARAQTQDASCFLTGGGTLQICRGEAEGVFFTPRLCELAANVHLIRLANLKGAPGPLQVVYQGETPGAVQRGGAACEPRQATNPLDGGSVRSGRMLEQLATTMPATRHRLWEPVREMARPNDQPSRSRGQNPRTEAVPKALTEGMSTRNPMVISGRDWAGEAYFYVFLLATVPVEVGNRHVLIQARTFDFERFDVRGRMGESVVWTPFAQGDAEKTEGQDARPRVRQAKADNAAPAPSAVLDETGKPITSNCPGRGFDTQGLVGSISVVDQVYHYFYTDVVPTDCNEPAEQQRMGLYLRTSKDLTAERVWSSARTVAAPLPSSTLVRVAKAKGMDRWVVSYSCNRPANTMDGPVADLCVQYTPDLSIGSLANLTWFSEPITNRRSEAYLGLRSGGDGSGRFGRAQHFWMTDRYGNLETPTNYSAKAGFLTWLDRLAPGADGSGSTTSSTVYGRPVYWGTWSVRAAGTK